MPTITSVLDAADAAGIPVHTLPSAFTREVTGELEPPLSTPELRYMYNRLGFEPTESGTYVRNPVPVEEEARQSVLRQRLVPSLRDEAMRERSIRMALSSLRERASEDPMTFPASMWPQFRGFLDPDSPEARIMQRFVSEHSIVPTQGRAALSPESAREELQYLYNLWNEGDPLEANSPFLQYLEENYSSGMTNRIARGQFVNTVDDTMYEVQKQIERAGGYTPSAQLTPTGSNQQSDWREIADQILGTQGSR